MIELYKKYGFFVRMSQQHMFAFAMRRAFISLRHHPVTTTTDDVRHSICKGPDRLLCLDVTLEITHGVIRSRK